MNRDVLRTSLVWLALIAGGIGLYWYHSRGQTREPSARRSLQPVASGSASHAASEAPVNEQEPRLDAVQLTPERIQSIGVETGTVESKEMADHIRATGTVDIDERLVSYVQVRFSGYIRKVFADATYQLVRKGDPLFTIYSPDLVATENEYLLAVRNENRLHGSSVEGVASGATALTQAAEARLQQWNVPQADIAAVKETGQPISDLLIPSPVSGYVTERAALPNLYVEPATRLYTIADLTRVWVYAQVFQDDVGRLKPNDAARITVDAYPGRGFEGRIESILPQVDLATRTVRVRLHVSNPDLRLRPGMFVNVDLQSSLGKQLSVPYSAVLRSGLREVAFLDLGSGRLQPQEVETGARVGDDVIVLKGLRAHQRIVTSANFLIDSESQLQAAAGSFAPPPPGASVGAQQTPATAQVSIDFSTDPNPPRKGDNTIRVKVNEAGGAAVSGADVSVTFYMSAMPAMGMAAEKSAATLHATASGMYEGTLALPGGGTWQATIGVRKAGQLLGTKQLTVNATGGM